MVDRRALWSLPALFAIIATLAWGIEARDTGIDSGEPDASPAQHDPSSRTPNRASNRTPRTGSRVRWLVAGGGPFPELNQVQIEQDLALAVATFEPYGRGLLLYAGGPGAASVQHTSVQLSAGREDDPLLTRLADLFNPRGGRDTTYRNTDLAPIGAASAEAITAALRGAMGADRPPLTLYLAGHGDGGAEPHESRFLTWGPDELDVTRLAEVMDEVPEHRPVRIIMTSCYSGGFAEVAFIGADAARGAASGDRCGFFATNWDRAASGCDPNPDRGSQIGYGIHFLHALNGQDRGGRDAMEAIDLDHDGVVSLAEAHARARVASGSLDVPVTTSERFLRAAAPMAAAELPLAPLPIERAVVAALSERLQLETPADVVGRLDALHGRLQPIAERLDELEERLAWDREELAAELLHRWPVLDDPWHPDFAITLANERDAIDAHLRSSGAAGREAELRHERDAIAETYDELLIEAAPMERLERALETLDLAARLQAEGGSYWERYLGFVACENGPP